MKLADALADSITIGAFGVYHIHKTSQGQLQANTLARHQRTQTPRLTELLRLSMQEPVEHHTSQSTAVLHASSMRIVSALYDCGVTSRLVSVCALHIKLTRSGVDPSAVRDSAQWGAACSATHSITAGRMHPDRSTPTGTSMPLE